VGPASLPNDGPVTRASDLLECGSHPGGSESRSNPHSSGPLGVDVHVLDRETYLHASAL